MCNYGPNTLYRNNGDGTFTDVTDRAGVGDGRWAVSAAFGDYDADGHLDLYVTNTVTFDPQESTAHELPSTGASPCSAVLPGPALRRRHPLP